MKEIKRKGGSTKMWDPKKGKYVKKTEEAREVNWVHKNSYIITKEGIKKGENTPYRKVETK